MILDFERTELAKTLHLRLIGAYNPSPLRARQLSCR